MPTVRSPTGDPGWDQTISTLGDLIAGNPAKEASAYYYGTKSRESLLQSNNLIGQGNWRNRYGMQTQGLDPGSPVWQQATNLPGAPPVLAPPSNLPMAGAPAVSPLAAMATGMTPQQAADMIPAAVAPMTTGTPPPVSPPSAVSPPAPNTTTSNGQVPQNDPVSGRMHPASLNTTGVAVQASPAQANGSPAPVPPGMTLPGLMAMHGTGALAGIDAQTLAGGGQALAWEMLNRKLITPNQYNQMLAGTGQAGPYQQDIQAQSALAVGAQTQAGETARNAATNAAAMARQQLVTGEARRADEEHPVMTVDEAGKPIYTGRKAALGKGAYDPTVASAGAAARAKAENEPRLYYHPSQPTVIVERLPAQARTEGMLPVTSPDQLGSTISSAIVQATPEAAPGLAARRDLAIPPPARAAPRTAVEDANEQNAQQTLIDQELDRMFPADPSRAGRGHSATDKLSGAASPDLGPVLRDLSNQYRNADPKGDRIAATQKAINQLVSEGYIIPGQTRSRSTSRSFTNNKTGEITQTPHFQVDLHDPTTLQPFPAGKAPTSIPMQPLSGAVTTPAPGAKPVPGATTKPASGTVIRPAIPGVPDGETGTGPDGTKYIVRGGNWVVQ